MRQDDIKLNSIYGNMYNQPEMVEEAGFINRMGARLGAVGGYAKQAVGNLTSDLTGGTRGASATDTYNKSKIDSILKAHTKDIQNVAKAIINDLNKLNLNAKGVTADDISNGMIQTLAASIEATGSPVSGGAPASITADAPLGSSVTSKNKKGVDVTYTKDKKTGVWTAPGGFQVRDSATIKNLEDTWRSTSGKKP